MGDEKSSIFKAYDIRGIYPDELNEEIAWRIGHAFVRWLERDRLVMGRDMRTSSPALTEAFARGASAAGATVVDVGLVSTDGLYFASGKLDLPGAMFTASHNPARYNGLKLCREKAAPIGEESGLQEIAKLTEDAPADGGGEARTEKLDILADYAAHCRSLVDESLFKPLKVAIDAANGMAGKTVPEVFGSLPFEVFPLYFELDGTFPNHPANPIEAENLVDLQRAVKENGCDVGIAFDGDADRIFLVDDMERLVTGSTTTAMVAERLLKRNPGASILYNLICSWTVPEVIKENGGKPIRSRVGHSFIKELMAETGAVFGGEHSGHYYFKDNFRADSGMIAALLVLEMMCEAGKPLSELLEPYNRYFDSGEINSEVADQQGTMKKLAETYSEGKQDWTDGLTVEFEDWWFNCRPSNTEPLLRLNLEARTERLMEEKRDEVLSIIRGTR
ncbi:MAG TPA: phosphomannomutase/phosphoglucomutase [Actinomycetota bacterium]|nr:phosphomannomutase/phosphoglucomutase [Actinomycetota bacterium]